MATSMPSYGIIDADSRCFFIINAQPGDEHLDKLIVINLPPTQAAMIQDEDDMWCLLIDDDEPAYLTLWMEFTMNHGSIASARFIQVFDDQQPMEIARFIVRYESESLHVAHGGLSEGKINSGLAVKIREKSEEEEEEVGEICVICREEYEVGQTIGAIECGHVFHEKCIKKWLVKKNLCPICRSTALS